MAIENIPAGKAVGAWNVNSPRNTSKNEGAEKLGWMSFQNVILQDVTPSFASKPSLLQLKGSVPLYLPFPKRFSPGALGMKPFTINAQIVPITGIKLTKIHQPDLPTSRQRLT